MRERDEFHLPMLYVTHDPAEAAALCDEVPVMERGGNRSAREAGCHFH